MIGKDSLDLEKIILFLLNSYYFRLIHGLIGSFSAFYSALRSWVGHRIMGGAPPGGGAGGLGGGGPRIECQE